jgi:poly(ADP-ribose) glycohydrolase ARH3
MRASETFRDRAIGAMLGHALGDAIGELAFSHPERDALDRAIQGRDRLRYTDDTAMAIALAEELVEAGRIDGQTLGERFARAFEREPWRGYGPGPPRIFQTAGPSGRPYAEVARELYGGEGSLGNGAAMRATPLGLAYADGPELAAASDAAAEVTHAHPVGRDAGLLQARATSLALRAALDGRALDPHETARTLTDGCRTAEMREKMQAVAGLLAEHAPADRVADAVGRSVAAHESVPFAVYAALAGLGDYAATLEIAMFNGGDRDTLAAMAGGIAGADLGEAALPQAWRERCENGCQLRELARRLAERFAEGG